MPLLVNISLYKVGTMKTPELTLKEIKKSPKLNEKVARVSDFVSSEDLDKLHRSNVIGKQNKLDFDDIDAYEAEIIGRFGYEVYKDWENGVITTNRMSKWLMAERNRETNQTIGLKAIIANGFSGCANHDKNGKPPKTSKNIQKLLKEEIKRLKGAK